MMIPSFDEVFSKIAETEKLWQKCLIGGVLSFIPLLNIFAFGYVYRYLRRVRLQGRFDLPEWNDPADLFIGGLRAGILWIVFFVGPIALALLLKGLGVWLLGWELWVLYLPVSFALLIAPGLWVSALHYYQRKQRFLDILELFRRPGYEWKLFYQRTFVPVCAFWGVLFMFLPLFGFVFFAGAVFTLPYFLLISVLGFQQTNPPFPKK